MNSYTEGLINDLNKIKKNIFSDLARQLENQNYSQNEITNIINNKFKEITNNTIYNLNFKKFKYKNCIYYRNSDNIIFDYRDPTITIGYYWTDTKTIEFYNN